MAKFSPNTVNVEVFRATRVVASNSLSFPMYAIPHNITSNMVDSFTDATTALAAGVALNSPLYNFIQGSFAGRQKPELVKVARQSLQSAELTVDSIPATGDKFSINVNVAKIAKVVSIEVTDAMTLDEAATALAAELTTLYPASDSNPTFAVTDNTVSVTPKTASVSVGYNSVSTTTIPKPHVLVSNTSTVSPSATIAAVMGIDNNFFFVGAENHTPSEVLLLAALAQTNDMIYLTSTSDTKAADVSDTANIALSLSGAQYAHTLQMYSSQADWKFPEALVVGEWSAIRPYNLNSLNLRTLMGLYADPLTPQQRQTLAERNCNFYFEENGYPQFFEGWMADGDFADVVRFSLWAKLTTRSSIATLLKQRSDIGGGVEYSDFGASELEARIWNDVVNVAIRGRTCATGWTRDPVTGTQINLDPIVEAGTRAQQTNENIGTRTWDGIVVEMVYISPIHHVNIKLYVILNRNPS